ncbi:endonuclease III domain-containing protein [Parasphaerochaeta coccoides]|uniref:Endonuclease III n=1 Tax=Parasphaerochaeta coccoides (strain ATCC BAA-1237 / DSM 17374 / SPN1) TaxID=760011 RepID=F4GHV4_PARC1|nr:endonuclease III [Parasphaerochaeta coccoides]AEC02067.1 DNA-(apurinic or apyrimidinic site) lyase [Parasphaerochaeta coccoides DSM 17374]
MNEDLAQKKDRAKEIARLLDASSPQKILFLDPSSPFRFLIQVILSAQTTDAQVLKIAPVLFETYPDVRSLAGADINKVKEIIRSTGHFNTKARHIIDCATILQKTYGGWIPSTMEELTALPGVGRKTASCVLGEVYGQPVIIVDTHFGRVSQRLELVTSARPEIIEQQMKELLPPDMQYRFSMTLNLFGRNCCTARKPQCHNCPLYALCPWPEKLPPLYDSPHD